MSSSGMQNPLLFLAEASMSAKPYSPNSLQRKSAGVASGTVLQQEQQPNQQNSRLQDAMVPSSASEVAATTSDAYQLHSLQHPVPQATASSAVFAPSGTDAKAQFSAAALALKLSGLPPATGGAQKQCRNRECNNAAGQPNKPRSLYCSKRCQSREQNLRQGRIKNVRHLRRPAVFGGSHRPGFSSVSAPTSPMLSPATSPFASPFHSPYPSPPQSPRGERTRSSPVAVVHSMPHSPRSHSPVPMDAAQQSLHQAAVYAYYNSLQQMRAEQERQPATTAPATATSDVPVAAMQAMQVDDKS